MRVRTFPSLALAALALSCASNSPAPAAPQPAYAPQPAGYGYPAGNGYAPRSAPPSYAPAPQPGPYPAPQPTYAGPPPQPQQPAPSYTPPTSAAATPAPQPSRPLLAPLVGSLAWQAEVRAILVEDTAALSSDNQARVRGIPLVFDPNPTEINAYAMCDDQGHPGIVGTEGLLEAIDAIAQTRATDELYGTHTYDQYTATVIPQLAQSDKAIPALPPGILPASAVTDPRRWSRAHEWFDEIVAFTFGHELSHHYLGHTGCAYGPPVLFGGLAQTFGSWGHGFVQPLEFAADINGMNNALDAGKARVPQYRWTEEGGLGLLDFFLRLENAAGPQTALGKAVVGFLNTHPSSQLRIPVVQGTARTWHLQHPG